MSQTSVGVRPRFSHHIAHNYVLKLLIRALIYYYSVMLRFISLPLAIQLSCLCVFPGSQATIYSHIYFICVYMIRPVCCTRGIGEMYGFLGFVGVWKSNYILCLLDEIIHPRLVYHILGSGHSRDSIARARMHINGSKSHLPISHRVGQWDCECTKI